MTKRHLYTSVGWAALIAVIVHGLLALVDRPMPFWAAALLGVPLYFAGSAITTYRETY